MRSKTVALLLADLGVTKTHSRPYTSTDNPFSEAQFKTMKYRSTFPHRFGCLQHARRFCVPFFGWYNTEHRHSALAMLTPQDVHDGLVEQRLAKRAAILAAAYMAHPERFPNGRPTPGSLPQAVWINKPVGCAGERKSELAGCHKGDDRKTVRGGSTPESGVIRPREEETLLVTAH